MCISTRRPSHQASTLLDSRKSPSPTADPPPSEPEPLATDRPAANHITPAICLFSINSVDRHRHHSPGEGNIRPIQNGKPRKRDAELFF